MSKLRKLETEILYRECPGGQTKVEWDAEQFFVEWECAMQYRVSLAHPMTSKKKQHPKTSPQMNKMAHVASTTATENHWSRVSGQLDSAMALRKPGEQ